MATTRSEDNYSTCNDIISNKTKYMHIFKNFTYHPLAMKLCQHVKESLEINSIMHKLSTNLDTTSVNRTTSSRIAKVKITAPNMLKDNIMAKYRIIQPTKLFTIVRRLSIMLIIIFFYNAKTWETVINRAKRNSNHNIHSKLTNKNLLSRFFSKLDYTKRRLVSINS